MTAYRILTFVCLCLTMGYIARDLHHRFKSWAGVGRAVIEQGKQIRAVLREFRGGLYVVSLLSFVVLGATGFGSILLFGDHLTGTLLIIHVTVAPVFALTLCAIAVLWAHRMRFKLPLREQSGQFWFKLLFWGILILSLPLLLSIIVGMYPVFGTAGEEALIQVHGYSALLLSCAALAHILFTTKLSKEG